MRQYLIIFLSLICFAAIAQQPIKNFERAQTKFDIPIARVPIVKNGDTTYYQVYGSLQGLLDSVGIAIPITDSLNQRGNALRSSDSLFYRQCPTCPFNFVTKVDTSNVNEFGVPRFSNDSLYYKACPTCSETFYGKVRHYADPDSVIGNEYGTIYKVPFTPNSIFYKACTSCPAQSILDNYGYIYSSGGFSGLGFTNAVTTDYLNLDSIAPNNFARLSKRLDGTYDLFVIQTDQDSLNELGNLTILGDSIYYQKCPTCVDSLIGVIVHPTTLDSTTVSSTVTVTLTEVANNITANVNDGSITPTKLDRPYLETEIIKVTDDSTTYQYLTRDTLNRIWYEKTTMSDGRTEMVPMNDCWFQSWGLANLSRKIIDNTSRVDVAFFGDSRSESYDSYAFEIMKPLIQKYGFGGHGYVSTQGTAGFSLSTNGDWTGSGDFLPLNASGQRVSLKNFGSKNSSGDTIAVRGLYGYDQSFADSIYIEYSDEVGGGSFDYEVGIMQGYKEKVLFSGTTSTSGTAAVKYLKFAIGDNNLPYVKMKITSGVVHTSGFYFLRKTGICFHNYAKSGSRGSYLYNDTRPDVYATNAAAIGYDAVFSNFGTNDGIPDQHGIYLDTLFGKYLPLLPKAHSFLTISTVVTGANPTRWSTFDRHIWGENLKVAQKYGAAAYNLSCEFGEYVRDSTLANDGTHEYESIRERAAKEISAKIIPNIQPIETKRFIKEIGFDLNTNIFPSGINRLQHCLPVDYNVSKEIRYDIIQSIWGHEGSGNFGYYTKSHLQYTKTTGGTETATRRYIDVSGNFFYGGDTVAIESTVPYMLNDSVCWDNYFSSAIGVTQLRPTETIELSTYISDNSSDNILDKLRILDIRSGLPSRNTTIPLPILNPSYVGQDDTSKWNLVSGQLTNKPSSTAVNIKNLLNVNSPTNLVGVKAEATSYPLLSINPNNSYSQSQFHINGSSTYSRFFYIDAGFYFDLQNPIQFRNLSTSANSFKIDLNGDINFYNTGTGKGSWVGPTLNVIGDIRLSDFTGSTFAGYLGKDVNGQIVDATLPSNLDNDSTNEIQIIDTFSIVSNVLYNSLSKDGQPAKTVNLTPYLDNTDSQNLSDGGKTGNLQTINISGGTGTVINIADGDSVKTNEIITAFSNTDSIRITEAGVTWAVKDNDNQSIDSSGFSAVNTLGQSLSSDATVKTTSFRRYEHHLNSSEAEKSDNIVFIGDVEVASAAETDLRDKGVSVFRYDPDNVTLLGGAIKVDGFAGLNAVVRISPTDSISIQHYGKHLNIYARGTTDSVRVRSYDADTSFSYSFVSNAKSTIEYTNATSFVGKTPTYDKLWTSIIKADAELFIHGIVVVGYTNIIDQSKTAINLDSLNAARWEDGWNQVVLVPNPATDTVGLKQIIARNIEGTVITNNETLVRDALNKDWTAMRLTTNYNTYQRSVNEVLEDCLNENSNVYDGVTAVKNGKVFLKEGNKRYWLKRAEIKGTDTLAIDGKNLYNENDTIESPRTAYISSGLSFPTLDDYAVLEIFDGDTPGNQQVEAYVASNDYTKSAYLKLTAVDAQIGRTGSSINLADSISINASGSQGTAGQVFTATGTGKAKWQTPADSGVTNVTASSPLFSSGGATPNLTIQNASTTLTGALTSTDWNTFNTKVGGSGTTGYFPYFSASSTLADSPLYRLSSTSMALGTTTNTNLLGRAGFNIMNSDPAFAIGKSTSHYWYQFMNGNNFEIYNPNYGSVITLQTDGKFKMTKYAGSGNRYLYANASGEVNVSTYDVISGTGTSNYIPKWTAARTLSPTSLLYDSGSYVGIGTASPSYLLDAQASNYGSYVARFKNAGSGNRNGVLIESDETAIGRIVLDVQGGSASSLLSVHADGSVGIGIATPTSAKMHLKSASSLIVKYEATGNTATSRFNVINSLKNMQFGINPDGNTSNWFGVYDATNGKVPLYIPTASTSMAVNWAFGKSMTKALNVGGGIQADEWIGSGDRMLMANTSGESYTQAIPASVAYVQTSGSTGIRVADAGTATGSSPVSFSFTGGSVGYVAGSTTTGGGTITFTANDQSSSNEIQSLSAGTESGGVIPLQITSGASVNFAEGTNVNLVRTASNEIQFNVTGSAPTGSAGGDLTGTYPNPTVDGLQGVAVSASAPSTGQLLRYSGSAWTPYTLPSYLTGEGGYITWQATMATGTKLDLYGSGASSANVSINTTTNSFSTVGAGGSRWQVVLDWIVLSSSNTSATIEVRSGTTPVAYLYLPQLEVAGSVVTTFQGSISDLNFYITATGDPTMYMSGTVAINKQW